MGAGGHTAAMPEGLAEFFVKACSPPGGVVLDPFAGSGTTPVVARRLGRRAGGLEIHKGFVDAARRRLAGPADPHQDRHGRGRPGGLEAVTARERLRMPWAMPTP